MSIFTKIINKEISAHIVYEDDTIIAFLDISQKTKGHTLVVTKVAYQDIFSLDEKTAGHLFKVVVKLSKVIKNAFKADGINLISNNGLAANQSVMHYHMHIIPRYQGEFLDFMQDSNQVVESAILEDYLKTVKASF